MSYDWHDLWEWFVVFLGVLVLVFGGGAISYLFATRLGVC